eukprot:m.267528 g.267528  ORF g.267528 m.267528 type:complete len:88 (+) comp33509_c0_seq1:16-279(+)
MSVSAQQLETKLKSGLAATHVDIKDTSGGCGSSFEVIIVSAAFEGKPLLARHRLVNACLEEELKTIHAFSQKTFTPKQWETKQAEQK